MMFHLQYSTLHAGLHCRRDQYSRFRNVQCSKICFICSFGEEKKSTQAGRAVAVDETVCKLLIVSLAWIDAARLVITDLAPLV